MSRKLVAADLMNDYSGKGGTFNGLLIGFWGVVVSTQQCMGEHDEGGYKLQSIVTIFILLYVLSNASFVQTPEMSFLLL